MSSINVWHLHIYITLRPLVETAIEMNSLILAQELASEHGAPKYICDLNKLARGLTTVQQLFPKDPLYYGKAQNSCPKMPQNIRPGVIHIVFW